MLLCHLNSSTDKARWGPCQDEGPPRPLKRRGNPSADQMLVKGGSKGEGGMWGHKVMSVSELARLERRPPEIGRPLAQGTSRLLSLLKRSKNHLRTLDPSVKSNDFLLDQEVSPSWHLAVVLHAASKQPASSREEKRASLERLLCSICPNCLPFSG